MIDLQELGLSEAEIQNRVVDAICKQLLTERVTGRDYDHEQDYDYASESQFAKQLEKRVTDTIDATVKKIGDAHILPNIEAHIEKLTLQKTTSWGEKQGDPKTFVEYMVERAESYMTEEVNHSGKTKKQDSYSWRKAGTRIEHEIDKYLQYTITTAMKKILAEANNILADGIKKGVEIRLNDMVKSLTVTVKD